MKGFHSMDKSKLRPETENKLLMQHIIIKILITNNKFGSMFAPYFQKKT